MELNTRNFSELVQRQAAAIQGRASQLIDFAVGSVLRAVVESNAGIGLWLQAEALRVLLTTRASTSTGVDLDTFVADYGLQRLGAQLALGSVTFSRFTPTAQALIPVGATVKTLDGTQTYQVVADPSNSYYNAGLNGYVLGAGISSLWVPVEAVTPGPAANVSAGFVGLISSSIPYVDTVTNAAAFTGGGEAESDATLRARFVNYILSLSRGTVPAIIFSITNLHLGLQATIVEHENFDKTPNEGFLCCTVATSEIDPVPSGVLLTRAYAAADSYRAGGVWVGVFPATVKPINVRMNLVMASGYDQNLLVGNVGVLVRGYLNTLPLGAPLYLPKLVQLAIESSPGVLSVSFIQTDAGPDVPGDPRVIIRAGVITVS